jgi:hypothetical protein
MTVEHAAGLQLARKLCAVEDQRDELLAALRKVPLFRLTEDCLGWQCVGCGSVSGINPDGSMRDEECSPNCYVIAVEAAIDKAEGR